MSNSYEGFEGLLKLAKSRKEVREDIDTKFISFMISSMNVVTMEYNRNFSNNSNNNSNNNSEQWDDELMITVNKLLDFIKHGIQAKGGNDND